MNLTREQIEQMEAGPEMDALIAEQIFDLSKYTIADTWFWEANDQAAFVDKTGGVRLGYTPPYSTGIAAAWLLVEFFAADNGQYKAWYEMSYRPTGAEANFTGSRGQAGYASFEECGPSRERAQALAICRAALLALLPNH